MRASPNFSNGARNQMSSTQRSTITQSSITELAKCATPEEQRDLILKDLGDLSQYELLDEECLVATYVESEVLSSVKEAGTGKIIQIVGTENRAAESRYQGKVALLIKPGPTAFQWMPNGQPYDGIKPVSGDWVVLHPSDGRELFLRGGPVGKSVACRRVHWRSIWMRVEDPRVVY